MSKQKMVRRRRAMEELDLIARKIDAALVIHYSCESFYDRPEGRTPRITSIAVRNLDSGQTVSFSIHKVAEQAGVAANDIGEQYDELEREMLKEFFEYAERKDGYLWLHWNMRDINYGFPAIEHRYRVLGGKPFVVEDTKKVDVARLLVGKFGTGYIGHPRLKQLVEKNHITDRDMLDGPGEAEAFDQREFVRLHQSTLRKVDVMANIVGRALDGSLKTNTKWRDIAGWHVSSWVELAKDHWTVVLIGIVGAAAGVVTLFL